MWRLAVSQVLTSVLEGDYASFFRAELYLKNRFMHTFPVAKYWNNLKKQKGTSFKTSQIESWHFVIYFNGRLFLDAVFFRVHIFYITTGHLTGSKGYIIALKWNMLATYFHIWPLRSSSHYSRIQFHAIVCFYSFLTHLPHIPFFTIFWCNTFRLSFYPVPLFYFPPLLFRYSSSTPFDIASQRFQLCSFS